jgi:hypothetical protein
MIKGKAAPKNHSSKEIKDGIVKRLKMMQDTVNKSPTSK